MIIDKLENIVKYKELNPLFADVIEFIQHHDLCAMDAGKHIIKGDDLFVNIQIAKGKTREEAVLEYHRKMIDIQIPLSGSESYGYAPVSDLPEGGFDEQLDMAKLPGVPSQSFVTCHQGMFAIFFPQDGHAPCITDEPELKKAIFKIKG